MFASLIRRKGAQSLSSDQAAFESTTFSLSTAVPRPVERRIDERLIPLLKVAKLSSERYGQAELQFQMSSLAESANGFWSP